MRTFDINIPVPELPRLKDDKEDVWSSLWRGSISEFFATLIFIFIGTGSVVAAQENLGTSQIEVSSLTLIALAHGFAIMVLVYAVGEVSGGHINPAVTWATLLTGKLSVLRAVVYWVSQITGAIVGSAILRGLLSPDHRYTMGCHSLNPKLTPAQGFGAEVIFTFIFIFVVFATAISPFAGKLAPLSGSSESYGPGKLTPFAVGATILILHTVGIPLTGASMNPARTFGPAVVNGCWDNMWIYWIGPFLGSTSAALICQMLFLSDPATMTQVFTITHGKEKGGAAAAAPLQLPDNTVEMTTSNNGEEHSPQKDPDSPSIMREVQLEQYENL